MKVKAHMRVAQHPRNRRIQIVVTQKPMEESLRSAEGPWPTVAFAIELEIPDVMFKRASQVIATVSIPEENATIAAKVTERALPETKETQ